MAGAVLTTRHRASEALQERASSTPERAPQQPETVRAAAASLAGAGIDLQPVGGLLGCIARALGFFVEEAGGADDGRERLRRMCCRAQWF